MTDNSYPDLERRKFARLNKHVKVYYTILSTEVEKTYHEEIETVTQNISAGGVCFETKESLSSGALLKMEIELPRRKELIQSLGKVIWQQKKEEQKHETGVAFFWITEEDRQAINNYVEENITEDKKYCN